MKYNYVVHSGVVRDLPVAFAEVGRLDKVVTDFSCGDGPNRILAKAPEASASEWRRGGGMACPLASVSHRDIL